MNKPPGLNALFGAPAEGPLGSVETPPILRLIRPATFVIWLVIFCVELQTVVSTGASANFLVVGLSTALFAGIQLQFWYEESEQGQRFGRAVQRMRGRVYEDEKTGLPNSRHFVFELRRQMMRSVRSGRGFSLVLTDIGGWDRARPQQDRILNTIAKSLRQAVGDSDFVARLQGSIFAVIVMDERERSAAEKADSVLSAIGACIPLEYAGSTYPIVSFTGYEGELEVRDFLRRAQRDLQAAQSHCMTGSSAQHNLRHATVHAAA